MSGHTPGPWTTVCSGHIFDGEEIKIGKMYCKADSALVSAAPDLLEALEEVVAISDRKHVAWDKARAAIAKAKGEEK